MSTLYDLSSGFNAIAALVEDETMDADELEQGLQQIEGDLQEKCLNGIGLIKSLECSRDGMKAESKRLADRARTLDERIKRIKQWYLVNLQSMEKDKVSTDRGTMSVKKNPPALVVYDEGKIPAAYYDVIPEHYELAKDRLKKALADGKEVIGARLTQGKSLLIR